MKKTLSLIMAVCMMLLAAACTTVPEATEAETTAATETTETADSGKTPSKVYKLGHVSAADYPVCEALQQFADKLYELTDGDIKVEVYTDGQLGQEADAIEAVKLGSMGMTSVNGGQICTFVPEYTAFTLPYIFKDADTEWAILNGEIGQLVASKFEDAGLHLISYMDEGSRHVYTAKKQVTCLDDLKGLKIRTTGSQASGDGFEALGVAPTPVAFGEVFSALEQGVVDGAENNFSTYYTSKHYEAAPYITDTYHLRVPGAFVMSLNEWNSLTDEQRAAIEEAAAYAREWGIERFNEKEQEYLQAAIDAGAIYTEFPEAEREKAAELLQPVFEEYKSIVGAEIMDGILNYGK